MKKALTATALLFVMGFLVVCYARQSVAYQASTPTEVLRTYLEALEHQDLDTFKRTLSQQLVNDMERNVALTPSSPEEAWKRFLAGMKKSDYFRSGVPDPLRAREEDVDAPGQYIAPLCCGFRRDDSATTGRNGKQPSTTRGG